MSDTQEQAALLAMAESGDVEAKKWADELGIKPQPATTGDDKKSENGSAQEGKTEEVKPVDKGDVSKVDSSKGVDSTRDGAGKQGGKPESIYAEVRRLKRERQQFKAERDQAKSQAQSVAERIAALEAQLKTRPDGATAKPPVEDTLARLLSKPDELFEERDKKLIAAVREAIQGDLAKARTAQMRETERSSAIKILGSIKDFNSEDDNDNDKVFEIMEKEYGLDQEDVENMLASRPIKTANLIKRAWEKFYSLSVSDSVKADKAGARPVTTGGARTHSKTSLESLDARAKGAKTKEDLDAIWDELEKVTSNT